MQLTLPVLLGTTRKGNESQKVARFLHQKLSANPDIESPFLDLTTLELPLFEARPQDTDNPPPAVAELEMIFRKSQGLLIVAPEYKNGYPAGLKNLLDYLAPQIFQYQAMGIATVSAGPFGGATCLAQLRLVCLACGGVPIPNRFQVGQVQEVFSPEGKCLDAGLAKSADRFVEELIKYTRALSVL